jgi:YVTN family beta-propeller protein
MTTRTIAPAPRTHRIEFSTLTVALALLAAATAYLVAPAAAAETPGGGGSDADVELRSTADLARLPHEFATGGPTVRGRLATPLSSHTVTPNDSFLVLSHGFDDLLGVCQSRGWTGEDLTSRVYAHVSGRFTVNNGFVDMGTKAFWFGADSASDLAEVSTWVKPFGYANGWSQRLTSPPFARAANPGAILRFNVSMELDRSLDNPATSTFTPYGLASGAVANDLLGVQALEADGSWAFLNGRFSLAGGPASWEQTPPLFANRYSAAAGATPTTMSAPNGIAADDSGNVYLADRGNNRILKFNRAGHFLTTWGTLGGFGGQFTSPFDVHVDHSFNVYVVDATNRVQKFSNDGTFITQWGSSGTGTGQFDNPLGVTTDAGGTVYVADQGNNRVQRFTSSGAFITEWSVNTPSGIAVDDSGYVYVTDVVGNKVWKFFANGFPGLSWGSAGASPGQFNAPAGIAVDRDGFVWVVDRSNNRIQRFDKNGNFLMTTGTFGGGGGHFFNVPRDIAIDPQGDVYVVESGNNRFQWFTIGGPIAGENTFKYEVRLDEDGNQDLALADSVRLRIVMQTSLRSSPADGTLLPGQLGVVLVDSLLLTSATNNPVMDPVDFEDGTTGDWSVSALNGAYLTNGDIASAIRDFPPPATSVELRTGYDLYDKTCVWTFLSPGDSLANGTYARLVSPWIGLVPGHPSYRVQATSRMNTLGQSRFVALYARGKNVGDTRPRTYHRPSFIFYGTADANEDASPLLQEPYFSFPSDVSAPVNADSVQIVIELLDQPERLLGVLPQQRSTAHLPIVDDVSVTQLGVDTDFDGVPDVLDSCATVCAAGQDANGDGCVDATATLHHVESWAGGDSIHFAIAAQGSQPNAIASPASASRTVMPAAAAPFGAAELAAIRAGFAAWMTVDGAAVPMSELPPTAQTVASMRDGINLVTSVDPEVEFTLGALAITPTTSFTRRSAYGDRIVLPGQIVDADMIINPNSPFTTTGEANKYDLQSVVTHEAGHLLGLSHTGVLDATMFFVIQPGEDARTLTDDDRSAIAAAYPSPALTNGYGTIQGVATRGQTGLALPGALIEAVRVDTLGALADTTASDYTAEDGSYALRRLPPGDYSVRITPLDGNVGGFPLTPKYISQRLVDIAETVFPPEWWSRPESDRDDPTLRDTLRISAGVIRAGVNITTNVDTLPPYITSVLPANGATDVDVQTPLAVNFSEPVKDASVSASFRLRKDGLPPQVIWTGQLLNGVHFVAIPTQPLQYGSNYEIEISPALKDLEGLALADTFRAVFRTQDQPPLSLIDIQPRSAPIGSLITITGTGFAPPESTFVGFDISALCSAFLVPGSHVTPTSFVVRVPDCVISGPVSIVTGRGISNEINFTVLPPTPQVAPILDGTPVALGGIAPTDAAVSPDGSMAYAAGDGGFASVNLALPGRPVTQHLAGTFRGLVLTPAGDRAVLGRASTGDVMVMGATPGNNLGVTLATVPVGGEPGGVGLSPNGKRAYVTDQQAGVVHELDIDPASLAPYSLLRDITLPGTTLSGGVAVSLDGRTLYLSSSNQGLLSVDLTLDPPVSTVLNPNLTDGGVAITPSGEEILASGGNFNSSLVFAKFPVLGTPSAGTVFIGGAPRDVAVTPEGQSALVVNSQTNELRVIDVSPGSNSPHSTSSVVGTGQSPLSVAVSSLSPMIAVANYGDRTLSIYSTSNADASIQRIVPDIAAPGDMAAVQTPNDVYSAGTDVDLGTGAFPASNTPGNGVGFVVPVAPAQQLATTLTLEDPNNARSLALPFQIVQPITTLAPTATGVQTVLPTVACSGDNDQGRGSLMRTSPDGRMVAMAVRHPSGCWFIHFFRIAPQGPDPAGQLLASYTSSAAIVDMAFTPDSRRLWVTCGLQPGVILNTDESSPPVGQSLGGLVSGQIGFSPYSVAADPLNRFMVVGTQSPAASSIEFFDPTTAGFQQAVATPGLIAGPLVETPDGGYGVMGTGSGAVFMNMGTKSVIPPPAPPTTTGAVVSLVVSTNGRRAFARFSGGQLGIWNLDPGAGAVGAELYFGTLVGLALDQLVPAPDGRSTLASCAGCTNLFKLDPVTVPPTLTSANIGQPFTAMTRSVDGRRLWGINSVLSGLGYFGDLKMFNLSSAFALSLVTGGGQSALASTELPVPVRVRVTDGVGQPQEGVVIRFTLQNAANDGVLDGLVATSIEKVSNINGEAEVHWTFPAVLGTHNLGVEAMGVSGGSLNVAAEAVANDADILPLVIQFGPLDGAQNINAGSAVFARFNQHMNQDSLPAYLQLTQSGAPVAGSLSFQDGGQVAVFQPNTALPFGASCVLSVQAGALDTDGQRTVAQQQATFKVESPPTLALSSLDPPAALVGATIVIAGEGFSTTPSSDIVTFNGVLAPVQHATLTSLTTTVPVNATSGPVTVKVGANTSGPLPFSVLTANSTPGQVVGQVTDNKGVSRVVFTPDGARAYVTNPGRNSVSVMDIATATITTSITVGLAPVGIAILPDGSRAYVANSGGNDVSVINTQEGTPDYNTVVGTIPVGEEPIDVQATGGGPRVFVANSKSGTVSIIDANPNDGTYNQVVTTVNTGSGSKTIAISADETRMYVGTGADVRYVDLGSLVVTTINTGSGCGSIVIAPDETIVLALLFNGTLAVIDASPNSNDFNKVVTTVNTGSGASAVSISPDEALAYVTSADGNVVNVYKIVKSNLTGGTSFVPGPKITLTLVATLTVGSSPSDIAISPTGSGLGLVTNAGSGTITIINFTTLLVTVEFDFNPNSLNLKSMGTWVTGFLEPPPPSVPGDIVVSSLRLNGLIAPDPSAPSAIGDHDGDGRPDLMVKFDRRAVQLILPPGDKVPVHVTGTIGTNSLVGDDSIKVKAGHVTAPHAAEVVNPLQSYTVRWELPDDVTAPWVALLHSLDHGATWKLDATHLPNSGQAQWSPPQLLADSVKVAVVLVEESTPGDTVVTGVLGTSDYFRLLTPVGAELVPTRLEFSPIWPSPSVGTARLRYGLPRAARVDLEVFDVQGRRLATLVAGEQPPGWHDLIWDGHTDVGGRAGTGLYFARLRAEGRQFKQRMIWLR